MAYKNLMGPDGTENNQGGTKQYLFWASVINDLLNIQIPDPADAETDDKYVVKTAHVCKSGKKFNQIYTTVDTSELEAAIAGQIDGRSQALKLTFFYPGSKKEVIKFMNEAKNDRFLFLVPLSDGTIFQLGSPDQSAYISPNFKSDKTTGRGKGTTFTVECWMPDIILYEATIPLTAAA